MAGTQIAVNIPSIRCPLNQRYPETKNEISTPNKRNKSAFLNINKPPLIVTVRKNTNQTTKNRETCWYPYMRQTPTFELDRNKTEQSTDCVRHSSDNQHPSDSDESEANCCSTFSVRFHPLIIFGNGWRRCKRCRTESFFDSARASTMAPHGVVALFNGRGGKRIRTSGPWFPKVVTAQKPLMIRHQLHAKFPD